MNLDGGTKHLCADFSPPTFKLQTQLRLNVSQVQVDECTRTDCKGSAGCYTQMSSGDTPTLLDSGALSLVSVEVTSSAVCGCIARELDHLMCSSYPTNPCLNGGTCIDTHSGYRSDSPFLNSALLTGQSNSVLAVLEGSELY